MQVWLRYCQTDYCCYVHYAEAKKQSKTPEKTALEMLAEYQLPIPCLDKGSEPGCLIDLSPGSIKPTSVAKVHQVYSSYFITGVCNYLLLFLQLKALNIIRKKREESTLSGRQKILKRVHDSQRGCEEEGPGGNDWCECEGQSSGCNNAGGFGGGSPGYNG